MRTDYKALLDEKMREKYQDFIDELRKMEPDELLSHCYEKVYKEQLVDVVVNKEMEDLLSFLPTAIMLALFIMIFNFAFINIFFSIRSEIIIILFTFTWLISALRIIIIVIIVVFREIIIIFFDFLRSHCVF